MERFRIFRKSGDEWQCLCPWHEDRQPSFSINLHKDKAHCFAGCYSGTATGAIKKLLGYLPQNLETAFEEARSASYWPEVRVNNSQHDGLGYMLNRGFTKETLKAWEIGYDEDKDCIAIPTKKRNGRIIGTIYRQILPEALPKYLYSAGFKVSRCLFGTHLFTPLPAELVYVVEGPLDCMWMWQCGYKSTVALLGCNMSYYQQKLFKKLGERIVLCLDNDKAGKKAVAKVGSVLQKDGFRVYVANLFQGKKDVQEHTKEQLEQVLRTGVVPFLEWKLVSKLVI